MIDITDEMRELINSALANGNPCILGTASPTGEPSVGFRGSMMVFDSQHLAYWERAKRAGLAHISANPKVIVMFRDPKARKSWKFHGHATVHHDGPIREQVMARVVPQELVPDPERLGFAILIRVDRILSPRGEVLQQREDTAAAP
ncbi:MAG: pyridoxamine 5'-phosphate oxidase family protein [Dehalococcoidia bacterium]|nr:pyridoxamine 5'-phosphate oxidase family protein [Dehalococcoidia bacterium]